MGWFDGFREEGRNTYYPRQRGPVIFDLSLIFVIVFSVIIVVALLIIIVGTRGKERWSTFLRIVFTLHTGLVIFLVIFGQEWQIAQVLTRCPYSTEDMEGLEADIHINVGLRSVNVTLAGTVEKEYTRGDVFYNERFWFVRVHEIQQEFESAKQAGLPQSILYILEYFAIDDGDIRWMRAIRLGGHFAFILLWSSLAAWILANIILCFEVSRGSLTLFLTGVLMVLACIVYNHMQPGIPLTIPFEDAYIHFHYGWCFWLCLISGSMTVATGLFVWLAHVFFPIPVGMIFLIETSHLEEERDKVAEVEPLNCGDLPLKYTQAFDNKAFECEMSSGVNDVSFRQVLRRPGIQPFDFTGKFSSSPSVPSNLAQINTGQNIIEDNNYDNISCAKSGDVINIVADIEEAPPRYVEVEPSGHHVTTVEVSVEKHNLPESQCCRL